MSGQHFYVTLHGPRPTFPADMTDDERALMQQHADYMQRLFSEGSILLYGPVMASPVFGVGILVAPDEDRARQLIESDPTVVQGLNRYSLSPMRVVAAQGLR